MIYLLSQMSLIILLAVIAGVALGWGFHRLRNNQTLSDLRRVIGQQQQHVKQAHTEVSMLSQDYDELKQTSSSTIESLRNENRQIPNLHQNLEKSQLLVRQLMQKHEAQIREYATENESLKSKIKHVDDRERALNKIQSDVERQRKDITEARKTLDDETSKSVTDEADTSTKVTSTAGSGLSASDAEAALQSENVKTVEAETTRSTEQNTTVKVSERKKTTQQSIAEITAQAREKARKERDQKQLGDVTSSVVASDMATNTDEALDMSADVSGEAGSLTIALAEADVVLAAIDKKREEALVIEDDEVIDTSELIGEIEFAGDDESDLLFDPVDQHDDLQTIFGIGPIFERSLNKLGITAYSQLAELKRHDIEKLAVALEIVPGKIERENWVGNARRQLEDVLEEL